jgi:hypothetical protein
LRLSTTQSIAHNTGDFILWIALQYTRPRIAKIHYKNTRPKIYEQSRVQQLQIAYYRI